MPGKRPGAVATLLCALALPFSYSASGADRSDLETRSRVDIRAMGYEPDWTFTVDQAGRMSFDEHRGAVLVLTSAPLEGEPSPPGGMIYGMHTEAQDLVAEFATGSCTDAKSGERLSHRVTIRVDGREYRGCGNAVRVAAD